MVHIFQVNSSTQYAQTQTHHHTHPQTEDKDTLPQAWAIFGGLSTKATELEP